MLLSSCSIRDWRGPWLLARHTISDRGSIRNQQFTAPVGGLRLAGRGSAALIGATLLVYVAGHGDVEGLGGPPETGGVSDVPTVLLIEGGWSGPWVFARLTASLAHRGIRAATLTPMTDGTRCWRPAMRTVEAQDRVHSAIRGIDGYATLFPAGYVDQSQVFSNNFTDIHLGGSAYGVITDRTKIDLTVGYLPASGAVFVHGDGYLQEGNFSYACDQSHTEASIRTAALASFGAVRSTRRYTLGLSTLSLRTRLWSFPLGHQCRLSNRNPET